MEPYLKAEEAKKIIEKAINEGLVHQDYNHVVKLAKKYSQLITGKDIEDLLKQFTRREDENLFNQRKELTQQITPSICATIMNPFYKVGRTNNIIKKYILNDKQKSEEQIKKIGDAVLKYNGDKSLDSYLETRFTELSFTDPNGFIITEFDTPKIGAKGELLEFVNPRPFECSSKQAIDFHYQNNILKWLLVKLDLKYNESNKELIGNSYTIYLDTYSIRFTQIDSNKHNGDEKSYINTISVDTNGKQQNVQLYKSENKKVFIVELFEHKTGKVPAIRVGYKRDLITDGRTCVNPLHDSLPYLMKSIKTVSEFDLTMALHAFPQKFQYVGRCTDKQCTDGTFADGAKCNTCGGTGYQIHSSAQDAIVLRLPRKDEELRDLTKMVHYVYPPIELLTFQKEYINEIEIKARKSVFNSEVFSKNEVVQTATEAKITMESVYDTLYPFAEKYSEVYKHTVTVIASLRDVNEIDVVHKFPKDFKFKTLDMLLAELKLANESNAPSYVKSEISMDIAEQQFVDKPEELSRIKVKQKFYPFQDKTREEILYIISNNKTTKFNEILYAHFDQLFTEIELENDGFYQLAFDKQREILKTKVETLIKQIESEEPASSMSFNASQTGLSNE